MTFFSWVTKQGDIHENKMFYLMFKARLKHKGHILNLVNLVGTLFSTYKKNPVLIAQNRFLVECFSLPMCSGCGVKDVWVVSLGALCMDSLLAIVLC